MALNLESVGSSTAPQLVSWDSRDVMLYALGVGAGQADPARELSFTTETVSYTHLDVYKRQC